MEGCDSDRQVSERVGIGADGWALLPDSDMEDGDSDMQRADSD
jgi:hypothetical protein